MASIQREKKRNRNKCDKDMNEAKVESWKRGGNDGRFLMWKWNEEKVDGWWRTDSWLVEDDWWWCGVERWRIDGGGVVWWKGRTTRERDRCGKVEGRGLVGRCNFTTLEMQESGNWNVFMIGNVELHFCVLHTKQQNRHLIRIFRTVPFLAYSGETGWSPLFQQHTWQ